jgi:hypothetical protein
LSQFSAILVNGDMFYRSSDGLRTLAMSQRNFQTSWINTPISSEAGAVLDFDDPKLLDSSQAVLFDNRVLLAVSPTSNQGRIYHRAMLALDFDLISSMTRKLPPAYDFLWTGLKPSLLMTGSFGTDERCFAMHYGTDGKNELWEVRREQGADNDLTRIACVVEGRSMNHGTPLMLKKMDSADLWVDNLSGEVDFSVQYRPDQYPLWFDWHAWSECATVRDCALTDLGCLPTLNLKPQYRARMLLPQPDDGCEDGDQKPRRLGYEFQARISWTGVARIKAWRQHSYDVQEQPGGCVVSSECRETSGCLPDALAYTVTSTDNETIEPESPPV